MENNPMNFAAPPNIGDVDQDNLGGGIGVLFKLFVINRVCSSLMTNKTKPVQLLIAFLVFAANFSYQQKSWNEAKAPSMYDHYNITRNATFEEIKLVRNNLLERITQNEIYESNLDRDQVNQIFEVLSNPIRRDAYDIYNVILPPGPAVNLGLAEKYILVFKSLAGVLPFLLIIHMSFPTEAAIGRRLAIALVIIILHLTYELKKPQNTKNKAIESF